MKFLDFKIKQSLVFFLCLWFFGFFVMELTAQAGRSDPFRADFSEAFVSVKPGETLSWEVVFKVPETYYLYDDKTSVSFAKHPWIEVVDQKRPASQEHFDPFFKKNLAVHFKNFTETVSLKLKDQAKGRVNLKGEIRYQGCSTDFCYRPVKKAFILPLQIESEATGGFSVSPPAASSSWWDLLYQSEPQALLAKGKLILFLLAFVGGLLTSLTPCVLPIIPLTLAFVGARSSEKSAFSQAFCLILGMVLSYAVLGFLAANLGLSLGFLFQSRLFLLVVALFFLLFSLGLLDILPFRLPQSLQNKVASWGGKGPGGAFVAGLSIGLIASPCVGPLMAPLLLIAAQAQDRLYGFLLLFTYGLGMGLLFFVLAMGWGSFAKKIKAKSWTAKLKKALALLMLLPCLYYAYSFAKPYLAKDSFWTYDWQAGLVQARQQNKPVIVDFYADWCPPCVELDQRTFNQPAFRQAAEDFVTIKVDCSVEDDNCQSATETYGIVGMPTILFLDSQGKILPGLSLTGGYVEEAKILEVMEKALKTFSKDLL